MAKISRTAGSSAQTMQHYISKSPWSGAQVMAQPSQSKIKQARLDIATHPHFASGSVLIGDESADDRRSEVLVGGSRQYNGERNKDDLSQVGVFLSLAEDGKHNWIDGELFLPKAWFDESPQPLRVRSGVRAERLFQTKLQLFWQMVQRCQREQVPFDVVAMDGLYVQRFWLRQQLAQACIEFYADVPANTQVYLNEPVIGRPQVRRGSKAIKLRVLAPMVYRVDQLHQHPCALRQTLTLRPTERGWLIADFARLPVWTVQDDLTVTPYWLLMRRQGNEVSYTLSNAPADTPFQTMALRKSQRDFIERDNQEAKSDLGWDEIQTTTHLDWETQCAHDPQLFAYYQVTLWPALSLANVRTLMRADLPLSTLSPFVAASLVVEHRDTRTHLRVSRLLHTAAP